MTSVLSLMLPCSKCGAKSGEVCRRRDGGQASGSHVRRTPIAPCGTYGGYQHHKKAGESACEPCLEANRRYRSTYRRDRPEVLQRDIAGLRARNAAVKALIDAHRDEFQELLTQHGEAVA